MTQYSEISPHGRERDGAAAATEAGISSRLREFYNSVQEEAIPERLLSLLERLEVAERQADSFMSMEGSAR